jgi:cytoplasmic iron level regulating protein YaaA (DUF328/UPF0246 family)
MGKVYELSNKCKLKTDFFEKVEEELKVLSEYFGTSGSQSLLVAMVFSLNTTVRYLNSGRMLQKTLSNFWTKSIRW